MKLSINLSDKKSIENAAKTLKGINFNGTFDNEVVNNLVNICHEKCLENLDNNTKKYDSTQYRGIREAIVKEYAKDGVGYVKIKPPAVFVEFGTGIRGTADPHPEAGEQGLTYRKSSWLYPTDADASNPNKGQDKNGNWVAFTRGQPAIAFGYNAAQYIKTIAKNEVKTTYKKIVSVKNK